MLIIVFESRGHDDDDLLGCNNKKNNVFIVADTFDGNGCDYYNSCWSRHPVSGRRRTNVKLEICHRNTKHTGHDDHNVILYGLDTAIAAQRYVVVIKIIIIIMTIITIKKYL